MIPPCFKTTPYFSNPFLFMEKIWTSPFCKTFENSIPLYKAVGFNCETMVAPVAPKYISFDDVLLGTCWHPQVHWTASHLIVLKIWISPVYFFFSLKFFSIVPIFSWFCTLWTCLYYPWHNIHSFWDDNRYQNENMSQVRKNYAN